MSDLKYNQRGVSAGKEDVHNAIKNIDKGLFPRAFCKIIPDILTGDPDYCAIMHADGAGTNVLAGRAGNDTYVVAQAGDLGDLHAGRGDHVVADRQPGAGLKEIVIPDGDVVADLVGRVPGLPVRPVPDRRAVRCRRVPRRSAQRAEALRPRRTVALRLLTGRGPAAADRRSSSGS